MTALVTTPESGGALAIDDLKHLMRSVSQTTERLQSTHEALQNQVAALQAELAEANARLRRSQALAALGEMAAGIAHEIRNPLGSIQLYAQMLGEDLAARPDQADLCRKISRAVHGLDAIVHDVLLFARDMKLRAVPLEADRLFDAVLLECESLLVSGKVQVVREAMPAGTIHVDERLMIQALGNVVRNAVEAMVEAGSEPRRLHVGCARRKVRQADGHPVSRFVLTVRDTGPGIARDVLERMFNPFFTTRKTGTGLGLSIVNRIIDAHGGEVRVESCSPRGARIELLLPGRPCAASPGAPDAACLSPTSNGPSPPPPSITLAEKMP